MYGFFRGEGMKDMGKANEYGIRKRIKWIDCAKAIAIIAVVVDHCYGILYADARIANASYFSVTLFVMLSGLSTCMTSRNGNIESITYQLKKILNFLGEYMIATFVIQIFSSKFFDFKLYVTNVLEFSMAPQFYFLEFFFQLLLISPILVRWCMYCNAQKAKLVWHLGTIFALGVLCSFCMNYTSMYPLLYGAGKYLFGGTFLLVYYIGILFGNFNLFATKNRGYGLYGSFLLYVG